MSNSIRLFVLSSILILAMILVPVTPVYAVTVPAEINQSFTPIAIVSGGISKLRVTIYNVNPNPLTNAAWSDDLVGVQPGISIANPPNVNLDPNCGGGTVTAVANTTTLALSGGTVPGKSGGNPGSCYVEVDVTSITPGNLINLIPAGALSATTLDGGTSVPITTTSDSSATLNVIAVQPPTLSKSFSPNTIAVGGTSKLTITVNNTDTNNSLTQTTLTDVLPAGLQLANPVQHGTTPILTGCGASATLLNGPGGSPVVPGDTTLTLNNGTIAKSSSCVIVVDVTSLTQGSYTNTIPVGSGTPGASIHTREGVTNASAASDNLNVQAFNLTKSFGTSPIAVGDVSLMTITIQNIASIAYSGVSLTDTLPAGEYLEYVDDAMNATTCGGSVGLSKVSPATTTLNTLGLTGGSISAASSCTITVNVRARMSAPAGTYTNTIPIGVMTTTQGATNHAPSSADLVVQSLSISKAFSPTTFAAGQTTTLTITIHNPSPNSFTGASLSDTLPTSPNSNLRFKDTPTTTCGAGAVSLTGSPSRTVTLTNGTIPGGSIASPGSCTITATVTTDANAPAASYTDANSNTIPAGAITTTEGGTNLLPASADVSVTTVSVSKSFSPTSIVAGVNSTLTITITNPATGAALTGIHLKDILPAGLQISGTPTSSQCGGGVTSTTTYVELTGGSLAAGPSSCTVVASVTADGTASSGTYTNTISPGDLTTTEGPTNSNTVHVNLTVQAISVVKAFSPTGFQAGDTSTLTITLRNPTSTNYTGVGLQDTLPSGLSIAASPAPTNNCGGTLTATSGTQLIQLIGGALAASTSPPTNRTCTLVIPVTSTTPGDYTNTILAGDLTTDQGPKNVSDSTASVSVYAVGAGVEATKTFTPATINIGGNSHLHLTFTAPPDIALSAFTFTDTLPAGVTVSNSTAATNTCGGSLSAATGAGTISIPSPGGSIAIGATCTVDVYVTSNTGSGSGVVYTNTIHPGDISDTELRSIPSSVSQTLTVKTPSTLTVSKAFYPTVVNPDGLSTLKITLSNTNAAALVNVTLTDNLPDSTTNGVVIASTPNANSTCGSGLVTASPGGQTISMTNGTVPAQVGGVPGLCTINVDVLGKSANGATPVSHTNTISTSDVIGTIQGSASTMNPVGSATARLTVQNIELEVVKGFDPQLVYGGTNSKMSITLRNPNSAAELTGISFTDNMPAADMILVDPPNFDPSDCGPAATMSGTAGTSTFSFSGGDLAAGAECTLTLDVTMTVNGNRTNTIPANSVTSTNGAKNKTPAAASLTNLAGASVSKSFSPGEISAGLGNYSILTITIRTTATVSLTQLSLVDNLPAGLQVAGGSAPFAADGCGGTLAATSGATVVQLSGGTLPVGFSSCSMTIPVTGTNPGTYTNTIPHNTLTNTEGYSNNEDAVATLILTPYSLGNRVWYDTNNDGLLNNGEVGISGVRVSLYRDNGGTPGVFDASDTFVGSETTDASGYYRFDNLDVGTYVVVIGAENFRNIGPSDTVPGDPLANYLSSGTSIAGSTATDSIGPDPNTSQTDSDDNGVATFSGSAVDYVSARAVTIGIGLQPIGETDPSTNPLTGEAPDAQNNRTIDFGFYKMQYGKTLVSTDADHTTDTNVAIGEIATYEVNTDLAAGASLTNVVLTDQLQKGLAYVDCLAVVVGTNDRTAEFCGTTPTNPPVVSAITDPGDSATNPANNGRQVVFNLGHVTNPGGDTTIRIRYRAVVLDVAENKKDTALHNTATWTWVGSSIPIEGPHLKVVEPDMSIDKSASPSTAALGSAVTYTVQIAHTASSNSDSFDVVTTDVLPAGLAYIDGSAAYTGLPPTSYSYDPATTTLKFLWDVFPLGQTSTVTFQTTFLGPPPVTNDADVEWTSLPLDPLPDGTPVKLSAYNDHSTERRYDPTDSVVLIQTESGARGKGNSGGGASGSVLPLTGFAPGVITSIPPRPANVYETSPGISLEIPALGINASIVGVPQSGNTWDVTWLSDQVGYLDGTAFPTWSGNSVLTGHVYLSNGLPGPFVNLHTMAWGEQMIVHLGGQRYIYQVRSDKVISPEDTSVLNHKDGPWLTLVTCEGYDAATNTYGHRVAVQAVLVKIETDPGDNSSGGNR